MVPEIISLCKVLVRICFCKLTTLRFHTFDLVRFEIGELKNAGTENEIQVVRGQYFERYYNEDRALVIRNIGYVADENGYRPFVISVDVSVPLAEGIHQPGISSAALASLTGGGLG